VLTQGNRSVIAYPLAPLANAQGESERPTVTIASEPGWSVVAVAGHATLAADAVLARIAAHGLEAALVPLVARGSGAAAAALTRLQWVGPRRSETRIGARRRRRRAARRAAPTPVPRADGARARAAAPSWTRKTFREGRDFRRARRRRRSRTAAAAAATCDGRQARHHQALQTQALAMPSLGHFVLHSNFMPQLTAGHYRLRSEHTGRAVPGAGEGHARPGGGAALHHAGRADPVVVSAGERRGRVRRPPAADRAEAAHAAVGAQPGGQRGAVGGRLGSRSSSSPTARPSSPARRRWRSA
jgi:hypothetical protein